MGQYDAHLVPLDYDMCLSISNRNFVFNERQKVFIHLRKMFCNWDTRDTHFLPCRATHQKWDKKYVLYDFSSV